MPSPSPRSVIQRLYRDHSGYVSDPQGEAQVVAAGSSATYGEMMPAATERLIEHLALGPNDAFYDLGSGVGKVVLQVAMTAPVARCVGIELMKGRHDIARRMLQDVRAQGLLRAQRCSVRNADILRARMSDATVAYCCSTAFPESFMHTLAARLARLPVGLRWVSTRETEGNPWFQLEDELRLDMSWHRRSKVYVYRLARRRR